MMRTNEEMDGGCNNEMHYKKMKNKKERRTQKRKEKCDRDRCAFDQTNRRFSRGCCMVMKTNDQSNDRNNKII